MNPATRIGMRGWLYWFIVLACIVGAAAGVAELVLHRYLLGVATIVVACVVVLSAYTRRGFFGRRTETVDEMKATTRGIPNAMRVQLTIFAALVSLGGVVGVIFAVGAIQQGAIGMGLLMGVPSACFVLVFGFGAIAFWLPKNRPGGS